MFSDVVYIESERNNYATHIHYINLLRSDLPWQLE